MFRLYIFLNEIPILDYDVINDFYSKIKIINLNKIFIKDDIVHGFLRKSSTGN